MDANPNQTPKYKKAKDRIEKALKARELSLKVEALICNPKKVSHVLKNRQWDLLEAFCTAIENGPPQKLAQTDPSRFIKWMKGLTLCYLQGWHKLDKSAIIRLKKSANNS